MINILIYLSLLLSSGFSAGEGFSADKDFSSSKNLHLSLLKTQLGLFAHDRYEDNNIEKEEKDIDSDDKQPFLQYALQNIDNANQSKVSTVLTRLFSNQHYPHQIIRAPPYFC